MGDRQMLSALFVQWKVQPSMPSAIRDTRINCDTAGKEHDIAAGTSDRYSYLSESGEEISVAGKAAKFSRYILRDVVKGIQRVCLLPSAILPENVDLSSASYQ